MVVSSFVHGGCKQWVHGQILLSPAFVKDDKPRVHVNFGLQSVEHGKNME